MRISEQEVEHVAALARLDLSGAEKRQLTREMNAILDHMSRLEELDTSEIPPTSHVIAMQNVFRPDRVGPTLDRQAALANAPEVEDGFFKVPKIIE